LACSSPSQSRTGAHAQEQANRAASLPPRGCPNCTCLSACNPHLIAPPSNCTATWNPKSRATTTSTFEEEDYHRFNLSKLRPSMHFDPRKRDCSKKPPSLRSALLQPGPATKKRSRTLSLPKGSSLAPSSFLKSSDPHSRNKPLLRSAFWPPCAGQARKSPSNSARLPMRASG
jgi:hypothetical protein